MPRSKDCSAGRSQFLTRGLLFQNPSAQVFVFDHIRHGTAQEILSQALAAFQLKSPCKTVSKFQWLEYFGLPVMTLGAVANYYGITIAELEPHIHKKHTYGQGALFQSGMLVLRDVALDSVCQTWHLFEKPRALVLLPPRAVLRLCLSLRPLPAVVAVVNALWDFVLAQKLNESTFADWHYICTQHIQVLCDRRIKNDLLLISVAEAKKCNLYPYIQHFGHQRLSEAWSSLFTYKGEFPPPRGNFYVKKKDWFDRVSYISLRK